MFMQIVTSVSRELRRWRPVKAGGLPTTPTGLGVRWSVCWTTPPALTRRPTGTPMTTQRRNYSWRLLDSDRGTTPCHRTSRPPGRTCTTVHSTAGKGGLSDAECERDGRLLHGSHATGRTSKVPSGSPSAESTGSGFPETATNARRGPAESKLDGDRRSAAQPERPLMFPRTRRRFRGG